MIARWLMALALMLAVTVPQVRADSWALPQKEAYLSPDQQTRLTVIPRELKSQLAYFEDKVANREPAGQAPAEAHKTAHARLERRDANGGWTRIWETPLVNEVAPTRALVANGGQYVVTFDNWHSVGYGPDVVVIYGADGRHVRSFALTDLLPDTYVRVLPRSVSSLWWGAEHRLSSDGSQLILSIAVPAEDSAGDTRETVDIAIDLPTARPVPPSGPAWDKALIKAAETARARDEAEAAWRAAFIAPLLGPSPATEEGWHGYLREAFYRLDPDWEDGSTATDVLRAPEAADYKPSETWLRESLKIANGEGDVVAIATLAPPDRLVRVLADAARGMKPGALARARIYVAVPAAWRDRAAAALAPTGATFIHLDPAVPIPQRPERLKRNATADVLETTADQLEAEAEKLAEETQEAAPRP